MLYAWRCHCVIVSCGWFCKAIFSVMPCKHLDCLHTSKHIIYYISHFISVKNVLSWCHIPRGLVMGAIIVFTVSDKLHPRWVICVNDRERERSLAFKMKHWSVLRLIQPVVTDLSSLSRHSPASWCRVHPCRCPQGRSTRHRWTRGRCLRTIHADSQLGMTHTNASAQLFHRNNIFNIRT